MNDNIPFTLSDIRIMTINYLSIDPAIIQDSTFIIPPILCKIFLSNNIFGNKKSLYYKSSNKIFRFAISMYKLEYLLSVRKLISEEKISFVNIYVTYFDELLLEHNLINITILQELKSEIILEPNLTTQILPNLKTISIPISISKEIIQKPNDIIMYKKRINHNDIQKCHKLLLSGYKISGIDEVFDKLHKQNIDNNIFILGIGYGVPNKKDWDIQPFLSESILKGIHHNEPFEEAAMRGLFEELSIQLIDLNLLDNNEYQHNENTMIYSIRAKNCTSCDSEYFVNNYTNNDNRKKKVGIVIYGLYEELESLLKVCYPYDKTEKISYYGIIPLNLLHNRFKNIPENKNLEIISSLGNIRTKLVNKYNPYGNNNY